MLALLLSRGELCVCNFVDALGITQSKASRHLRTLYHAGLLDDRRSGLWVHYRIAPDLDDDRKAVFAALRQIFGKRDLAELEKRLDKALAANPRSGAACAPGTPARARAASGGRK